MVGYPLKVRLGPLAAKENRVRICEEFWDKFISVSKAYLEYNPEAEIYDVFNLIREGINGGWTYTAKFLERIDSQILEEEQRDARNHSFG